MPACDGPLSEERPSACNAAEMFAAHLSVIKSVISSVARRHRLSADQAEEFTSVVYLKLIEQDYAILRKFGRRSSLRTYLTIVVQRLLLDHRITQWGKWRPSARARRAGPTAILLERLIEREGLSFEQARMTLQAVRPSIDGHTLARVYEQLPRRASRRSVREAALCRAISPAPGADARVAVAVRVRNARRAARALASAVASLSPEDQLILRLRFVDNLKINEIAKCVRLVEREQPKAMYRRLRRLLEQLGASLERTGIDRTDLLDAIGAFDGPQILRVFAGKGDVARVSVGRHCESYSPSLERDNPPFASVYQETR